MFAILVTVKLLIVAFIIDDSYGLDSKNDSLNYYEQQLAIAKSYKHSQCFVPTVPECASSENPQPGYDIIRWRYIPTSRVCAPVYMLHTYDSTCKDKNKLPATLKECEDLCGEPCIIRYASKLSEPGICMMNCHITPPAGFPKPCPENAKCCPRNYIFPTTTPVPTKKP